MHLIRRNQPIIVFPRKHVAAANSLVGVCSNTNFITTGSNTAIVPIHVRKTRLARFDHLGNLIGHHLFPRVALRVLPPARIRVPSTPHTHSHHGVTNRVLRRVVVRTQVTIHPHRALCRSLLDTVCHFKTKGGYIRSIGFAPSSCHGLLAGALFIKHVLRGCDIRNRHVNLVLPGTNVDTTIVFKTVTHHHVPTVVGCATKMGKLADTVATTRVGAVFASHRFLSGNGL